MAVALLRVSKFKLCGIGVMVFGLVFSSQAESKGRIRVGKAANAMADAAAVGGTVAGAQARLTPVQLAVIKDHDRFFLAVSQHSAQMGSLLDIASFTNVQYDEIVASVRQELAGLSLGPAELEAKVTSEFFDRVDKWLADALARVAAENQKRQAIPLPQRATGIIPSHGSAMDRDAGEAKADFALHVAKYEDLARANAELGKSFISNNEDLISRSKKTVARREIALRQLSIDLQRRNVTQEAKGMNSFAGLGLRFNQLLLFIARLQTEDAMDVDLDRAAILLEMGQLIDASTSTIASLTRESSADHAADLASNRTNLRMSAADKTTIAGALTEKQNLMLRIMTNHRNRNAAMRLIVSKFQSNDNEGLDQGITSLNQMLDEGRDLLRNYNAAELRLSEARRAAAARVARR